MRNFDGYYTGREKVLEEGYITGATEQKVIDNKKVKDVFSKVCGWLSTYLWYNEVLEKFVKELEK